jgi:hypothetical protein
MSKVPLITRSSSSPEVCLCHESFLLHKLLTHIHQQLSQAQSDKPNSGEKFIATSSMLIGTSATLEPTNVPSLLSSDTSIPTTRSLRATPLDSSRGSTLHLDEPDSTLINAIAMIDALQVKMDKSNALSKNIKKLISIQSTLEDYEVL